MKTLQELLESNKSQRFIELRDLTGWSAAKQPDMLKDHLNKAVVSWHGICLFRDGKPGELYAKISSAIIERLNEDKIKEAFSLQTTDMTKLMCEVSFKDAHPYIRSLSYDPREDVFYVGVDLKPNEEAFLEVFDDAFRANFAASRKAKFDKDDVEHVACYKETFKMISTKGLDVFGLCFKVSDTFNLSGDLLAKEVSDLTTFGFWFSTLENMSLNIVNLR